MKEELTKIWYEALKSKVGIRVATDNIVQLKAQLYNERRELADPHLKKLEIRQSPDKPESEIWVAHKEVLHARK